MRSEESGLYLGSGVDDLLSGGFGALEVGETRGENELVD